VMRCEDKDVLGRDVLEAVELYLRQGPFYAIKAQAEVDTMS
jgi:hypothetical protein